ncbi:MAG: hypothetical protein C4536_10555 [Actinobacteria bacterium]|nr:MAG: hypothetical protein C4536_10555 [Actinomycetota bacterium]
MCSHPPELYRPTPTRGEIFYARPFATFKNHYPVTVEDKQKWYGECAVESCAISNCFNQYGDCEGATLRPGNVHSAEVHIVLKQRSAGRNVSTKMRYISGKR